MLKSAIHELFRLSGTPGAPGEEAGERVKQWEYKRELFSAPSFAELARKYSHAKGPQISTTPRSTRPTRGPERDVGPSR